MSIFTLNIVKHALINIRRGHLLAEPHPLDIKSSIQTESTVDYSLSI